jgi:light-regulated signal transduction histidine kinase (bacteriophytochrome)
MSEIAIQNDAAQIISGFAEAPAVYSSFTADDRNGKLRILQAITNSTKLNSMIDQTLSLRHFVCQPAEITDPDTGEVKHVVRTILLTHDGKSYDTTSEAVVRSLQTIVGVMGVPSTWDAPIDVAVQELRSSNGRRFLTLSV